MKTKYKKKCNTIGKFLKKRRGHHSPLLQATILFHLRGLFIIWGYKYQIIEYEDKSIFVFSNNIFPSHLHPSTPITGPINKVERPCGKVVFHDEISAQLKIAEIQSKQAKKPTSTKVPKRYYWCDPCKGFHLTSMSKALHRDIHRGTKSSKK